MIYCKKCSCFSLCFTMLIFKIKIKGITSISSEKCFNNIIIFFLKMLKIWVSWATLNGGKRERGWPYLWRQIEHLFYFCYVYFEPIFKQVRTVRVVYFIYDFAFNSSVLKIPHFNNVLLKLIFSGRHLTMHAHWGILCVILVNNLKYLKSPLYFTKIYSV